MESSLRSSIREQSVSGCRQSEHRTTSPSFTLSPTNRGLQVEANRCAEEARNTVWVRFCFDGAIVWLKFGFANTPWVLRCTRKDGKECIVGFRLKLEIEPSWPTTERANRNNVNCTRASRMRGCPSPVGYYRKLLGAQQIDWQRMHIGERAVAELYEGNCGDNG